MGASIEEKTGVFNAHDLNRRPCPDCTGTGELLQVLGQLDGQARPATRDGVWFSGDGSRALLVAQTRAAGYDIDAQERALGTIRGAFAQLDGADRARLLLTGPGVFSVASRAAIKGDAVRFSLIATLLIGGMMLAFYRLHEAGTYRRRRQRDHCTDGSGTP